MSRRTVKLKKPDAILTADLHIRPDTPVCRTDDYFKAMESKIDFIINLSKTYDCPILAAGDIGNHPGDKENKVLDNAWPAWLLSWAISKFKQANFICIPGQHDLPSHQLSLWGRSGLGVLHSANAVNLIGAENQDPLEFDKFVLIPFPYGYPVKNINITSDKPIIAMTHQMVVQNKELWPGQITSIGHNLLKQFTEFSLILSGDNHTPFVSEFEDRLLINPGSLMRNTVEQENHTPRVYLWYSENNTVEVVYLPISQGVITKRHIDISESRTSKFDALITRVKEDVEIKLSYSENMNKYLNKFRTKKSIVDRIWECVK